MTLQEKLTRQIIEKSHFQQGQEAAPDCILWPDKTGEWQGILPVLRAAGLPVVTLGVFNPALCTGPASYLLWSIHHGKHASIPVLYLPGVGVEELKAGDNCRSDIYPVAALRYRSNVFCHQNGRDWTLPGWFSSSSGAALKLEDSEQAHTMLRSGFNILLPKEYEDLLETLWTSENLTGAVVTDPVLAALQWLGADGARSSVSPEFWSAFCAHARKLYGFNPEKDSALEVAGKLAQGSVKLKDLWTRFSESPLRYPGVLTVLERLHPPKEIPGELNVVSHLRYPLWFKQQQDSITVELRALTLLNDTNELQHRILKLWKRYQELEGSLWLNLGMGTPLLLLKKIQELAVGTMQKPLNTKWSKMIEWYSGIGNKTDFLMLDLMAWKNDLSLRPDALVIVQKLYIVWLETITRSVEQAYQADPAVFTNSPLGSRLPYTAKEVVFFVDALRFDLGVALQKRLEEKGMHVELQAGLTVLPSTTATAKAAVSPLAPYLKGGDLGTDDAYPKLDGKPCNAEVLRKGLQEHGWTLIKLPGIAPACDKGWLEHSEIDTRGHEGSLCDQWSAILDGLVYSIQGLLASGWKTVRIVTDHGWLLCPQALPKTELARALVSSKGGRAAIMSPDSVYPNLPVPWYWDPLQNFNLAPGISTFYQASYVHGGLSFQELVVPTLWVTGGIQKPTGHSSGVDASLAWKGLRLRISMDEHPESWNVDLRLNAGDSLSSILGGVKPLGPSIVVEDTDYEGKTAEFVILNDAGSIVFQKTTVIGQ